MNNRLPKKFSLLSILLIGAIGVQTFISCSNSESDLPAPSGGISDEKINCISEEIKIKANTLDDVKDACKGASRGDVLSLLPDFIGTCDKNDLEFNKTIKSIMQECEASGEIDIVIPSPSSQSANNSSSSQPKGSSSSVGGGGTPLTPGANGPVAYYGKLKASGNSIVGSKTGTTAVQVRGVSLGWSNTGWEPAAFFNTATINAMVDDWKAEIIRVPIGYAENGGYKTDASNKTRVKAAVDAAIAKGVYVIIDWHSHDANNELSAATDYFKEMAQTYGSYDNVIFEIFNEPLNISWSTIKTYATSVISTIRTYSDNLILVGTPNWDQDVNAPVGNFLSDGNVAYVMHFYAYTHPLSSFQAAINAVRTAGKPVFVSEYGTTHADGGQPDNGNLNTHSASATDTWMTFLNTNKISYCAWNVNNKNEGAAFFKTTFTPSASAGWTNTSNMTSSGQYIYNKLVSWANSAPWRTGGSGGNSSGSVNEEPECGGWCYWEDSGCVPINTDPTGEYGTIISTCTEAIWNCEDYSVYRQVFSNSTCGGGSGSGGSSSGTGEGDDPNWCGTWCLWDTGCYPLSMDPTGEYGDITTNCTEATYICNLYGILYTKDATCGGYTTSEYCYNYDGMGYCDQMPCSATTSQCNSKTGASIVTYEWCRANNKPIGYTCY